MLEPGDFVVMLLVMFGIVAALVLVAGAAHARRSGTLPKPKPRRDRIADGSVTESDIEEMLEAENARLRANGHEEITRAQFESRIVGDEGFRRRVGRLRRRRHPERAKPLA